MWMISIASSLHSARGVCTSVRAYFCLVSDLLLLLTQDAPQLHSGCVSLPAGTASLWPTALSSLERCLHTFFLECVFLLCLSWYTHCFFSAFPYIYTAVSLINFVSVFTVFVSLKQSCFQTRKSQATLFGLQPQGLAARIPGFHPCYPGSNCHLLDHRKGKRNLRKTSTSASLTNGKSLTMWIIINCENS